MVRSQEAFSPDWELLGEVRLHCTPASSQLGGLSWPCGQEGCEGRGLQAERAGGAGPAGRKGRRRPKSAQSIAGCEGPVYGGWRKTGSPRTNPSHRAAGVQTRRPAASSGGLSGWKL